MQPNASSAPRPLFWDPTHIPELVLEPFRADRIWSDKPSWTKILLCHWEGSPVTAQGIPVPEGFVSIARCSACGSRAEHLVDCRSFGHPDEASLEVAIRASHQPFQAPLNAILAAHRSCTGSTLPSVAPNVLAFAEVMGRRAGARLQAGTSIGARLFLLRAGGAVHSLRMDDARHGGDMPREVAQRLAVVRDTLRSSEDPLVAAVLLAHCWTNECDTTLPSRVPLGEGMMVTVATPDLARIGFAPIPGPHSKGKKVRRMRLVAPGAVAPVTWRVVNGPSLMTDGLFARDLVHPLCPEDHRVQVVR
jgi:hypothetical protein